jgi:crotonobetainyl-CoA:carnitine CoA-transferase CaiB-like acyl-CoA transferase
MTHPDFGDYWRRGPVIRFDTCESAPPSVAPSLGEHTVPVLAELGYAKAEYDELIRSGVVRGAGERKA